MKRDGDLFKKDFTQSPSYRKWRRQMAEIARKERSKARWEKFWSILGGIILVITGYAFIVIFLSM